MSVSEAAQDVIRRKLAVGVAQACDGGPGADRGWRLALARAARDRLKMHVDVTSLKVERRSLAELLELPPDLALIAMLEGPGDGLGLIILSPAVLAGFIEVLTIGKVATTATPARKPTRTDAAMVAGVIDAALGGLEDALADEVDLIWAGGFRYASFIEEPRPLGLLLEDVPYRVLTATIAMAQGAKSGDVLLVLPANGRGQGPLRAAALLADIDAGPGFTDLLAANVEAADCRLDAVLTRLTMPIARAMALKAGDVLPLGTASLDLVSCEGMDGRRVAEGRLGQNRGMRAVRLLGQEVALTESPHAVPLLATGSD